MRSMEEEVDVGVPRDDFLSEDDHSPTDASEDSVEVRVTPIRTPARPPSPPTHPKLHKYRKHYSALRQEHAPASPPSPATPRPTTPVSPLDPTGGAAPLPRSRRKPAEPRRLCQDPGPKPAKRPHSPDPPRAAKTPRPDTHHLLGDNRTTPSPSPPVLAPHPLLGHIGRPPMGPFPPLLLPPAWPPVAAQWGYPRVVAPLGWPGLSPHPYPMLLPHPYSLPRSALHASVHPTSPPPRSPAQTMSPIEDRVHQEDMPLPLVTRGVPSRSPLPPPTPTSTPNHHHPHQAKNGRGTVVNVGKRGSKVASNFLSVESLIGGSGPTREAHREPPREEPEHTREAFVDSGVGSVCDGVGGEEEGVSALLPPGRHKQRNYKNMTRERRIEANARERSRVHTISAAFEKLRSSVPAYSSTQKLSKLSVLRVACSYIMSLARLAGHDYSEGGTQPTFSECVDLTTRTIQVEGKAKKKRDE